MLFAIQILEHMKTQEDIHCTRDSYDRAQLLGKHSIYYIP